MGKRGRRRHREATALQGASTYSAVLDLEDGGEVDGTSYLTPSQGEPLLRIVIGVDAPDDVSKRALCYWSLAEDGSWSNRVAELGLAGWVTETVRDHAYAQLLSLQCPNCGRAPATRTRSELDALRNTHDGGKLCQDCASKPQPVVPRPAISPELEDAQHHEQVTEEEVPSGQGRSKRSTPQVGGWPILPPARLSGLTFPAVPAPSALVGSLSLHAQRLSRRASDPLLPVWTAARLCWKR